MTRCATVGLVLLLCMPCSGQESGQEGEKPSPRKKGESKVDARALVEALASRNRPPKHVGEEHTPLFDAKFDWEEDDRVWRTIDSAAERAEEVWPELVRHLNDDRYCTTYESFSEYTYDLTVAGVCREIIMRNLSSGYFENVRPTRKVPYLRLNHPHFLPESQTLKGWCEERRGKKLYELQIELCDWAAAELAKPGAIPQVEDEDARKWIASIKKDARSLARTKKAALWDGFGHIEFRRYSRTRAGAAQRERDAQRRETKARAGRRAS